MLLIILLSTLAIFGGIAGYLIDSKTFANGWATISYSIGICSAITLIIISCLLIGINRKFDAMIYQYETTVEMVNSYAGQDYGNMSALVEQVVNINNSIANHKARYDSVWDGLWYSERIGNLEPIKFGRRENKPMLE